MSKRSISEVSVSDVHDGPSAVIGSFFKGFRAPRDTKFQLYRKKASKEDFLLHGENDRLEYQGETDSTENAKSCVVGVYDPAKNSIELYKAPILVSKVLPKSTKDLVGPTIKNPEVSGAVLRNALGEAFGTKKAKKAIADMERNRIDSDKLVGSALDIVDTVRAASKALPSREEMRETVSNDRPAPVANVDATDVELIYPIENIIPKYEMSFIRVSHILKETELDKKLESFPFVSKYITKKVTLFTKPSQTIKLQLLYYLSLLLGVYHNRRIHNKVKLMEKLNSPPETLVDGILDRFAVLKTGQFGRGKDRSYLIDPYHEDMLLCYMFTIILHLDNFIVEIPPLAQELGLKPSRVVSLFRTLGAIVKGATVSQAEAIGIPKSSAPTYKIATLKVPFKLPEMARRGRGSRR